MVFVSANDAKSKNGKLKPGVKEITDKNGRTRYVSSAVVNKDGKKDKNEKPEKKNAKSKGVDNKKKKDVQTQAPEDKLIVEFDG